MRGKQLIIIQPFPFPFPFPFYRSNILKFTKPFFLRHQDEPRNNVPIAYMSNHDREINCTLSAREVDGVKCCLIKAHDFLKLSGPHWRRREQ